MPKKSRDEFKAAFKTLKKPAPPNRDVKGTKAAIDKAIDKGLPDETLDGLIKELVDSGERAYIVKLVAYKFAKHYEDGSAKRPAWATKFPPDIFKDALALVVPNGIDDPLTQRTLERAVGGNDQEKTLTGALLFERERDKVTDYILGRIKAAHDAGNAALADGWVGLIPASPENTTHLMATALEKGDLSAIRAMAKNLPLIIEPPPPPELDKEGKPKTAGGLAPRVLDMDAIGSLAKANPQLFAKEVLPRLKDNNSVMMPLISDEGIRAILKKDAPVEWQALVDRTPMLKVFETLETRMAEEGLDTPDKVVGKLFDLVVNNEGIDLAYYTNTFYTPGDITLGPSEAQQKMFAAQREINPDGTPDGPASQCSMLTNTIQRMLEFSPGMKPKPSITQKEVPKMAMTVPLASLKRAGKTIKGLLDKSFPGNVFDTAGHATGRVLFTGSGGLKAHTWLVVNGEAYDSVLGTRGAEVEAAVEQEFRWIKPDAFAKGKGGSYIIQVNDRIPAALATKPKVASNKMGFSTAYVLTDDPDGFLSEAEKLELGLAAAKLDVASDGW